MAGINLKPAAKRAASPAALSWPLVAGLILKPLLQACSMSPESLRVGIGRAAMPVDIRLRFPYMAGVSPTPIP